MARLGKKKRNEWTLFCALLIAALLSVSACTSPEEKMDAIQASGQVDYFGKVYRVQKIDRQSQAVFIIEPDGVAVPVPLENVKPVEAK